METKTIIYVVAAALILRVIIKVVVRYNKENNVTSDSKSSLEDKTD